MKFNKLDLILEVKLRNLNLIFYLIAFLIVIIPGAIVVITDVPFSSAFTKISIGISMFLVLIGKVLSVLKKDKGDKNIAVDMSFIIGILIAFIAYVLR
ncbi:hypothetical protein [Clostridium folliculivorans]|uniref:Uncharacterized protein n=1 Tax=Clostridium folliculivorans TaxID=2886038 RepID=A0A9W5Y0B2_9CLOT|nr:hypothetical protein [Clostridium folliculivorans]GKU24283.1 hypothetical protein CFOLD11_11090 [Clostridium folliculivorans]GKU30388.1 hypothetical protein CFB3_24950 [Clostridium folliculivorans]